jgi:hypothetical protein
MDRRQLMTSAKWGIGSLIAAILLGMVGLGGVAVLVLVLAAIAGASMSISDWLGRAHARLKGDRRDRRSSGRANPDGS